MNLILHDASSKIVQIKGKVVQILLVVSSDHFYHRFVVQLQTCLHCNCRKTTHYIRNAKPKRLSHQKWVRRNKDLLRWSLVSNTNGYTVLPSTVCNVREHPHKMQPHPGADNALYIHLTSSRSVPPLGCARRSMSFKLISLENMC